MIACQGRVTLVKLNGRWREGLRKLPKSHHLFDSTTDKIIQIIASNPLPQGRALSKPYYKELGPYDVGNNTELTFTNHHFFLMAWIITLQDESRPESDVLTRDALMQFYIDGGEPPYAGMVRSYWLPSEFNVIRGHAPIPDVLIYRHFRAEL